VTEERRRRQTELLGRVVEQHLSVMPVAAAPTVCGLVLLRTRPAARTAGRNSLDSGACCGRDMGGGGKVYMLGCTAIFTAVQPVLRLVHTRFEKIIHHQHNTEF